MPHPRKIPGIDLYSGFIKNAQGGAIQNPKNKSRYNMLKGGGGQFEILKKIQVIDFYSSFRKTSQGGAIQKTKDDSLSVWTDQRYVHLDLV